MMPRVLIVEDNEDFSDELVDALRARALDVRCVSTAEDAMPLLVDWRPKYMICDIHLPGLSGDRLSNIVRSVDHKVLIIMMSADDNALAQMDAYNEHVPLMSMRKPIDLTRLVSTIDGDRSG